MDISEASVTEAEPTPAPAAAPMSLARVRTRPRRASATTTATAAAISEGVNTEEERVLDALLSTLAQSSQSSGLAVATTTTTTTSTISCTELLKFPNFQAKMMAKLQKLEQQDQQAGRGSETDQGGEPSSQSQATSQQNVFKTLMSKIKSLETSQAILELYTSQISDCYRSVLGDHDRLLAEHERKQSIAQIIDVTRKEEELARKEATRSRIAGADRFLQLLADRGFADGDLMVLLLVCCIAGTASVLFSIAAFVVARIGKGSKDASRRPAVAEEEEEKVEEEEPPAPRPRRRRR